MKKALSYLRWILFGAAVCIVLTVVVLGIYSRTEAFRRLIREQLIAAVNSSIHGTVTLERLEGSLWSDITLHDVRLHYRESDILRIPRLNLTYALLPLLRGRLQISRAEAAEPWMRITQDPQGRWNLAEALALDDTTDASEAQFSVLLKSLVLNQGTLDLQLMGPEPTDYHLQNARLDGRLVVDAKGVDFAASEISGQLRSQGLPELSLRGSLTYLDTGTAPVVKLQYLRLASADSRLKLTGEISDFTKPTLIANLAIEKLAAADLSRLVPDWPGTQNLVGTLSAKGRLDAMTLAMDIGSAAGHAMGNFIIDIDAPTPRFQGKIQVTGIDARTWLVRHRVAGILNGHAEVKGTGMALDQLDGAATLTIGSAEVKGWKLGDLSLQAKLQENTATLNGSVKGALGGADWHGTVTLAKIPRYDLGISITDLDIEKVSATGETLGGAVNLKGIFKGSGWPLAEMKTSANLEVLASSIGPVKIRNGALIATLAGGRIRIIRGALGTADSSLFVNGDIGVDLAQQGKLDYEFRSENIVSWLALAGQKGSGSLTLAGSAQGNLSDLRMRGSLKVANLVYDKLALKNGALDFDLTRSPGQPLPRGVLTAQLSEIHAGAELEKLDATVRLAAERRSVDIELKAKDRFERNHTFAASVDYHQADAVARVSRLSLDLPDGIWKLAAPATLIKSGDRFTIQKFALRNGDKAVALNGHIAMTGEQALQVNVNRFPLDGLAALLPKQPSMTGLLALEANVGGSAASPEIAATINLSDAQIGGQEYSGLVADLSFRERLANLSLTVRQDAAHALTAIGNLPLLLSWHDGWRSEIAGDLDLRVKSAGLSLAFLNAYTAKTVRDLGGELSLDLIARGHPAEPTLTGSFRLSEGKFRTTLLNVQVEPIAAEGSLDSRSIRIQSFSARANGGAFDGSALLTLQKYKIDHFKMSLAARKWPAVDTRRYRVKLGGKVELEGTFAAPTIAGTLEIVEANLRPDLAFLERSSTAIQRDATITLVNRDGTVRVAPTKSDADNGLGESELFDNLRLDLTLKIPGNVWIRHTDASAELRGNIHATKIPGQDLQLTGSSEITRGWAAFQGRRFDFVRGEIRFLGGGTVDPALDMVAQHRLPRYTVSALVGGTVAKPSLLLRSDPALDQADILALLVFGRPITELNRSEELSLQQNAIDITSGFAAAKIGAAVSEAIGLDSLGFDLGDLDFSGGRVGYGRYIGRQTYVTLRQELDGEHGQKATVEYQLTPNWKVGSSTTSEGSSEVEVIWHKRY